MNLCLLDFGVGEPSEFKQTRRFSDGGAKEARLYIAQFVEK